MELYAALETFVKSLGPVEFAKVHSMDELETMKPFLREAYRFSIS